MKRNFLNGMKEIDNLVSKLRYEDGVLFWKCGHRFGGKKAGYLNKYGYIQIRYKSGGKYSILGHRLIFYMFHKYLPKLVDHIDQNPLNNNIDNLRDADKRVNSLNRPLQKNNTTGHKGIYINTLPSGRVRYLSRVVVYGKNYNLGSYDTLGEAIESRLKFIKENNYDI